MKVLDIPLHLQAVGSEDCGPTSSLMILDYFGITSDSAEVISKVPRCNFGTSSFDNANVLIDYGLKVEMVTAHPKIFDGNFIQTDPTHGEILEQIDKVSRKEKDKEKKEILNSLHKFVKRGGKLNISIPTIKIIKHSIDKGKPVWVSMQANALGADEGDFHTVVVGGYRVNEFLVFNPWPLSRKKSWENAERLMFGVHASTSFDYDNGTILLVDK